LEAGVSDLAGVIFLAQPQTSITKVKMVNVFLIFFLFLRMVNIASLGKPKLSQNQKN
jgi:hypothetical protein